MCINIKFNKILFYIMLYYSKIIYFLDDNNSNNNNFKQYNDELESDDNSYGQFVIIDYMY